MADINLGRVKATVTAGTASVLPAGSPPTVTNTGTTSDAIFNFGIPRGQIGPTGQAASVTVGTTTTGTAGSNASVTNTGTPQAAVLQFTIPQGATGPGGPKGDTGTTGTTGPAGVSPTIAIGSVTTLAAGTSASITNSGTSTALNLDFGIPKGDKGTKGDTGDTGAAATIAVTQTLTLSAGSNAKITETSDSTPAARKLIIAIPRGAQGENAVTGIAYLDDWDSGTQYYVIDTANNNWVDSVIGSDGNRYVAMSDSLGTDPVTEPEPREKWTLMVSRGAKGEAGVDGLKGDKGDPGQGVITGGTTGQVLSKTSSTDYDVQWTTPVADHNNLTGRDTADQHPQSAITGLTAALGGKVNTSDIGTTIAPQSHVTNTSNPHSVTKDQVGLTNVTDDAQVKRSEMGEPSGVATLDSTGKVPAEQLNVPQNAVVKTGDTMTGDLILPETVTTNELGAVHKKYVDQSIAELESDALTFKGFISTVTPTVDVREGNFWYQPASAENTPDLTFPWNVFTYTNGAWSTSTTSYTPTALDLWSNLDEI